MTACPDREHFKWPLFPFDLQNISLCLFLSFLFRHYLYRALVSENGRAQSTSPSSASTGCCERFHSAFTSNKAALCKLNATIRLHLHRQEHFLVSFVIFLLTDGNVELCISTRLFCRRRKSIDKLTEC